MPAALVTGASRGIGAATALRLAQDGRDVAVHYHQDAEAARRVADAIKALGRDCSLFQADLGDPEAAWSVAESAAKRFPELDLFVNNAGIYDRTKLTDMTGEAWRRTMTVNLDGPAAMCQALHPTLAANEGSMVHISSIVAMRGSGHGAHYTASKAALLGLTKAQAREWAPMRVNAICPGYIDTDILAGDSPEKRAQREAEVPLGRIGSPEDIADAVAFLAHATYTTGQILHVNGGLWAD